jgi:FkbM family methyltransferase
VNNPGEGTRVWCRIPKGLGKGLWVCLDSRFDTYYAGGNYEPLIERALSTHLRPGSVFYDCGAHLGVMSMLAARIVGDTGAVFAFEPDPENVARIREHALRNGLHQINIMPRAVWSCGGGRLLFRRASPQSSRNQGAIETDPKRSGENTIEVESICLDEFAQKHPSPTVIKIDVEGAEPAVLRGSKEVVRSVQPVLICEVHNDQASKDAAEFLLKHGYTFEWLQDSVHFPRHLVATRTERTGPADSFDRRAAQKP